MPWLLILGRRSPTAVERGEYCLVTPTERTRLVWVARIFGIGVHLPMLLVFVVQGLVLPTEGVLLLVALWVAVLGALVVLWQRRSLLIALVPVVDLILLYSVNVLGRALFDWRASGP